MNADLQIWFRLRGLYIYNYWTIHLKNKMTLSHLFMNCATLVAVYEWTYSILKSGAQTMLEKNLNCTTGRTVQVDFHTVFKWSGLLLIRKQYFYTKMSQTYTRMYLFIVYIKRPGGDYWSDGPFLDLPAIYSAIIPFVVLTNSHSLKIIYIISFIYLAKAIKKQYIFHISAISVRLLSSL